MHIDYTIYLFNISQSNLTDDEGNPLYLKETAYAIVGLSKALNKLTGVIYLSYFLIHLSYEHETR